MDFTGQILRGNFSRQPLKLIAIEPKSAAGIAQVQLQCAKTYDLGNLSTIRTVDRTFLFPLVYLHDAPVAVNTSGRAPESRLRTEGTLARDRIHGSPLLIVWAPPRGRVYRELPSAAARLTP